MQKERYSVTGERFPMRMILKVVGCSSSTWYEKPKENTAKRGKKPKHSDAEVLAGIKDVIGSSEF